MSPAKLLPVFIVLFSPSAYGQWVPIVAKTTQTTEVFAGGQKVETHVRDGNYYRKSDGTVLEEWMTLEGGGSKPIAILSNVANKLTYKSSSVTRTTTGDPLTSTVGTTSSGPQSPTPNSKNVLPQSVVAGVSCFIHPVKPKRVGQVGPGSATGKACISRQFSLVLSRDVTYLGSNGRTYHDVYVINQIQLNIEPNAALFDFSNRNITVQKAP